ncbi:endonuclease domain-containing protein [Arenimonas sp. MALMAid1274]|uniref:endonuclease domain-containing protein n=1 Tax=Arenimonas sp. MALMAid1274 TaxID=3411630 RepID=UPI003BA3720D
MRLPWHRHRALQRSRIEAVDALWQQLRDPARSGCRFRRQHPIAGYVADFACAEAGLVVEVDRGDVPERRDYDRRRTEILGVAGYRVLRVTGAQVLCDPGSVLALIAAHVAQLPPRPAERAQRG